MKTEVPSYLESFPNALPSRPPVVTRPQALPFEQLTWENFERICLRLARREADVRQCLLYGTSGQGQRGIDFIGYVGSVSHRQVRVYQCKREKKFGPAEIRKAVDKFLAGDWDPNPARFVLCCSLPLRDTDVQDEIGRQAGRLAEKGIEFKTWDSDELSDRLKDLPNLVDDFFGRAWVQAFSGPEFMSCLGPRLSGEDVLRLRERLFGLYATLFDRHDPALPDSLDRQVSYGQRYIPPDIGEQRVLAVAAPTEPPPGSAGEESFKGEIESRGVLLGQRNAASFWRGHPISQREFTVDGREPALQWLPKFKRTVVLGEPGIGKSAMLRFIALSLLDSESPHKDLACVWGERLPVWMSFNAWTRAISFNEAISLEDFLLSWLHQHSADDLTPLLREGLKDHRLLLLIDGLDERFNEEAASVALDRLDAFLAGKDIPVVLTSRPTGYERVRRPSGEWRHGRLLDLSNEQARELAHRWFSRLTLRPEPTDAAALTAAEVMAEKSTDMFFAQLAASPRVRDLARVPLLLRLLVEVSRHGERLPEHRIKAYDLMVDHLLRIHPARRRQAAGVTRWEELVGVDDLKEAMARLALRIQKDHGGGYAPTETCQEVLVEYLSDPSDGLGYSLPEARTRAHQLIQDIQQGLGLLVERGSNELGFIHLTLQEYLAASMIAAEPKPEQIAIVEAHWRDPGWSEVLISLLGLHGVIRRDRRFVETLIDHIRSLAVSELDRLQVLPLLAEAVFGELGLPPARARVQAEELFEVIEELPFAQLQRDLAGVAVQGLRCDSLRETVAIRLRTWFSARDEFSRRRLLAEAMAWEPAEDIKKAVLAALRDEDTACRMAAARTLAKIFSGDATIGAQLLAFARRGVRPELREAALIALAQGWPSLNTLPEILENSRGDRHPGVRLSATLARIDLRIQDARDLGVLQRLGQRDTGITYSRRDEILTGIIRGWPGSQEVKQFCVEALRKNTRGKFSRKEDFDGDEAAVILIEMFPGDSEIGELLAERIRGDEFAFGFRRYEVWGLLAKHFRKHPALSEAATAFLRRRHEKHPAIYPMPEEVSAMVVAGTPGLRDQLINSFPGDSTIRAYWMMAALTEAWPEDEEVRELLLRQLDGPARIAAEVAPFISALKLEPEEQRRRLLAIVRDPNASRVWITFSTLLKISQPSDKEILEAGLESLTTRRYVHDDHAMKELLIKAYPQDQRIEQIAWDLWNEQGALPEFLGSIYGAHPRFRPVFLQAMRPANTSIRLRVAECLNAGYVTSRDAVPILKTFLHEHNPVVRTSAVLSLASHARHDDRLLPPFIETLTQELRALGMDYEDRRAAAVAGLIHLGEYAIIRDARAHDGKPEKFGHGLEAWKPIEPLIRELLGAWPSLQAHFGDELYERFATDPTSLWEVAAPWISAFPALRSKHEMHLKEIAGKPVGPNTLRAMAALFPRSAELRDTCLEIIKEEKAPNQDVTRIAACILGQHFGGDHATLDRLRSIERFKHGPSHWGDHTYWGILLAMCYGWPEAPELQEWLKKPREQWRGMPWHIALHLGRIAKSPAWVLEDIGGILQANVDQVEVGDDEVGRALLLWASEEENRSPLVSWLDSPQPSDVATAAGLLARSGTVDSKLRTRLMGLFEHELSGEEFAPRAGLDLSVGELRVIAESIYDAIRR